MIRSAILSKKRFAYLRELAKLTNSDLIALSKIKSPDLSEYDIVFNWGIEVARGINPIHAMKLSSHKKRMRQFWAKENLPSTPIFANQDEATYPYIVRPTYHSQGDQFFLISNKEDLDRCRKEITTNVQYFSPYIDKDREFRVHIMGNAVLFIQEKYREDGKKIVGNWNHTNGYIFRILRWSEIEPKLAKLAVEALKVSGLFFGAIDIMQKGDKYFLLEINTAPRLERRSIELYTNAINYYKANGKISRSRVKQLFINREGELDDNA